MGTPVIVQLAAGIDGIPTLAEVDEMLAALTGMDRTSDVEQTIEELLEIRSDLAHIAA